MVVAKLILVHYNIRMEGDFLEVCLKRMSISLVLLLNMKMPLPFPLKWPRLT